MMTASENIDGRCDYERNAEKQGREKHCEEKYAAKFEDCVDLQLSEGGVKAPGKVLT